MKIRVGFVSNSSCTSFCIYGTSIEEDDVREFLKLEEEDNVGEIVSGKLKGTRLIIETLCDESTMYIGRPWQNIGDDETGRMFKQGIEDELMNVFGKTFKCYTIEEAQNDN